MNANDNAEDGDGPPEEEEPQRSQDDIRLDRLLQELYREVLEEPIPERLREILQRKRNSQDE